MLAICDNFSIHSERTSERVSSRPALVFCHYFHFIVWVEYITLSCNAFEKLVLECMVVERLGAHSEEEREKQRKINEKQKHIEKNEKKLHLKRTYSKLTAYQLQLNLYQFFSIMFIFLALAISFISAIYYICGAKKYKYTHTHTHKTETSIHRKNLMEKFNKNEVARLKFKTRWKIEQAIRDGFWNWNCDHFGHGVRPDRRAFRISFSQFVVFPFLTMWTTIFVEIYSDTKNNRGSSRVNKPSYGWQVQCINIAEAQFQLHIPSECGIEKKCRS